MSGSANLPAKSSAGARALAVRARAQVDATVLEFQSPTAAMLATPIPASARGTIWVVASLVIACGAAMGLIPIDKVVTSQGRVVSVAPTVVVQPLETSIVRSINVQEGQVVHAGDVLARLDPTFTTADVGDSTAQVASLSAEVARLQAEIADRPYKPTQTNAATELQSAIYAQRAAAKTYMLENYQEKINSLKAAAEKDAADVQGYQARLKIAADLESKRIELERLQVGSQINRLQATDNRLEMARGLADSQGALQGSIRDLQAQIAQRDNYVQQWRADASQQLTEQGRKLSDAQQSFSKDELRHNLVDLRADQDAVVLTVAKVSVGSVLQSGQQFITLVPMNAPLEVESVIAGVDAGYVGVGDTVSVKFDTFPYIRYGMAEGSVRTISSDSFSIEQQQQDQMGGNPSQPSGAGAPGSPLFYRARIQLDHINLHDTPANFHVTPGMPVTADIKVGKRTVLSYLLGRVLPVTMDGMREP